MDTATNNDLQLAFDFTRYTNRNIFLTGKAGTGKTTFLHDIKKSSSKRLIVVAPTGVAAINAGGVTIHSFFQLPFHPFIPALYKHDGGIEAANVNVDRDTYRMSREKINIIKSLDLLIIDEISMVRADTLDAIDNALRRYKDRTKPFGGIQLLMIGDLQQLAPVVRDDDREILGKYYESFFFFGSRALSSTDYVTIELKKIYRQSDEAFISLLNKVRNNNVDNEVLDELNLRYIPGFDPDSGGGYITLTTHNSQARAINDSKLEKLSGRPHTFTATVKDEFPEQSYPNASELILKAGAQVMFIKNDLSGEKLFFNGKIGNVLAFEDDVIVVKCPGDENPIMVERAEWQNMKYTLDDETKEIEETVIGTFIQYPLRLAWAITIHKSQGLTFERAVIDAQAAFAHGQVYVALSRCRSLDGLVLSRRISQRSIIDNPHISEFISDSVKKQPGPKELEESKNSYRQHLLNELFSFSPLLNRLAYCTSLLNEHKGSILGNPADKINKIITQIRPELVQVSEKFQLQMNLLQGGGSTEHGEMALQDRIMKAAAFFLEKLEIILKELMDGFRIETDNRAVRKSVKESLDRARKEAFIKLACLKVAKNGFEVGTYLSVKAKSELDIPEVNPSQGRRAEESPGRILHQELFEMLREWRSLKAMELDVPHFQIMHQKTLVAIVNQLPRNLPALIKVKGMGAKTTAKYGEELLDIINFYCGEEKEAVTAEVFPKAKVIKKIREDTKKTSLNLFLNGRSIPQIADERNLNISTIERHLAHYVEAGELPLSKFVSQEKAQLIARYLNDTGEFKMGPVKEVLGDMVSWSEIRFVISSLKSLNNNIQAD